jgi:hypothetical protein
VLHLPLVLVLGLAACGGSGRTSASATTSTTSTSTTTEHLGSSTAPATTLPTTVAPTTRTTDWTGLPPQFPVLPDDSLILTDDSTKSQSLSITRVDLVSVHDWFLNGIGSAGFEVTYDDGYHRIEFHGRGSDGTVMVTDRGDGVHVDVVIEQFRPFR